MGKIFCRNCGAQVEDTEVYCMNCGAKIPSTPTVPVMNAPVQPMPAKKKVNPLVVIVPVIAGVAVLSIASAILLPSILKIQGPVADNSIVATESSSFNKEEKKAPSESSASLYEESSYYNEPSKYADNDDDYHEYSPSSKVQAAPSYPDTCELALWVKIEHNIKFAKYDVDVYIDDKWIATLSDSEEYNGTVELSRGNHTIKFSQADDSSNSTSRTIIANDDLSKSFSIKRRAKYDIVHGYGIEVTES